MRNRLAVTAHLRPSENGSPRGFWGYLGPGHAKHHVNSLADDRTACGREVDHFNHHSDSPGSDPCTRCFNKVRSKENDVSPSTKTKKAPKAKDTTADVDAQNTEAQMTEKMKKIRAQRRVVKKRELDVGRIKEDLKLAREELEADRAELYRLIDDSPQGELFVGHVDTETGEIETDDDES